LLADERSRKRKELLQATEKELTKVANATQRAKRPLRGIDAIRSRVAKVIDRYKVGKHFDIQITSDCFTFSRKEEQIRQEAAVDGLYVVRTDVPSKELTAEEVVRTYKSLSQVERAFRTMKMIDLKIRPIHHRLSDRVRAHVFLCMLAYYVEWHMRQALAPLLFDDHDKVSAEAERDSVVRKAKKSPAAQTKASTKQTPDGFTVSSFRSLLAFLGTIVKNWVRPAGTTAKPFALTTIPTAHQRRALDLLGVALNP
jgi:transposase